MCQPTGLKLSCYSQGCCSSSGALQHAIRKKYKFLVLPLLRLRRSCIKTGFAPWGEAREGTHPMSCWDPLGIVCVTIPAPLKYCSAYCNMASPKCFRPTHCLQRDGLGSPLVSSCILVLVTSFSCNIFADFSKSLSRRPEPARPQLTSSKSQKYHTVERWRHLWHSSSHASRCVRRSQLRFAFYTVVGNASGVQGERRTPAW